MTVRKAGQLGGLYACPKCEARNGTAVRDDRVLAIPGQILIGVEDLVKSRAERSFSSPGPRATTASVWPAARDFVREGAKIVLVRWIFMTFSPFNAFIMTEQGEKI